MSYYTRQRIKLALMSTSFVCTLIALCALTASLSAPDVVAAKKGASVIMNTANEVLK